MKLLTVLFLAFLVVSPCLAGPWIPQPIWLPEVIHGARFAASYIGGTLFNIKRADAFLFIWPIFRRYRMYIHIWKLPDWSFHKCRVLFERMTVSPWWIVTGYSCMPPA